MRSLLNDNPKRDEGSAANAISVRPLILSLPLMNDSRARMSDHPLIRLPASLPRGPSPLLVLDSSKGNYNYREAERTRLRTIGPAAFRRTAGGGR